MEKRNYMMKNFQCTIDDHGNHITDPKGILQEHFKFYKKLYTRDNTVKFNLTRDPQERCLSEEQKSKLEENLTTEELFDAVMSLKNGKVCGSDGLPLEFYKKFFHILKVPLLCMFTFAYKNGLLPTSTKRGIVSLLPKKLKDPRFCKNLRPLTILNYDFKILSKTIDNRLRTVIHGLIADTQTGFLSNQNISTNVRKTIDVIEYCNRTNQPGVILSIDMEKCFDRIDHSAITGALRYFNFGESFICWSSLLFTKIEICTQNYGYCSQYFVKGRSINQGCCYSPSVYLLISEIMANKLKLNKKIKGIKIGETEMLLSQFADDMDLYLPFNKIILNEVLSVLQDMETNLGVKISYDKTILYRIGSIAHSDAKLYTIKPVKWSSDYINMLGINIFNNSAKLSSNYDSVINKVKAVSKIWYYRNMTIMGKILLINTLFSSLFVYKLQVIPDMTKEQQLMYEQAVNDFLWKGKRAKVAISVLKTPKDQGGLGLVDIAAKSTSLMLNWIPRIQTCEAIKHLANYFIGNEYLTDQFIWKANLHYRDIKFIRSNIKGSFWEKLLIEWCKLNFHTPQSSESILDQIIWMNSHIKREKEPIFNHRLLELGLKSLQDIFCTTSNKFFNYEQFKVKFGTTLSGIQYYGILDEIPADSKRKLLTEDVNNDCVSKFAKYNLDNSVKSIF